TPGRPSTLAAGRSHPPRRRQPTSSPANCSDSDSAAPITVRKALVRHHLLPAPRRGRRSGRQFVREHADQILATDFFTVDAVWLTRLYVLFFIELSSRRVHVAGCTYHTTGEWVVQQARNLAWKLQDGQLRARFLLHDRDSKFTVAFDDVYRSES